MKHGCFVVVETESVGAVFALGQRATPAPFMTTESFVRVSSGQIGLVIDETIVVGQVYYRVLLPNGLLWMKEFWLRDAERP